MKKYDFTLRQVCFVLIAYNVCSKLLLYPNDLAHAAGNDLLFSSLTDLAVQTAAVWAAAFLCSKTDLTLFGLLQNTFGKTAARIIICLFAAFFALSALFPMLENRSYVHTVFYDTVPSLLVFSPFFIFSVYAGSKGLNNSARCADICLPIFAAAMIFIFALSFGEFDGEYLLPILKTPVKNIGGGALYTLHYFSEGAFMLALVGRFKYKKGDCAKITLSYALGGVILLIFLALFYGIFGSVAVSELYAVSKVSVYFPAIDLLGRIDLAALYALEIVSLFYIVFNIQLCCNFIAEATGTRRREIISLAVNAALFILAVALDNRFHSVGVGYSKWLWIVYLLFSCVAPAAAWGLKRRRRL